MSDREQVIKALRACRPVDVIWCQMRVKGQCDYAGEHCMARLLSDAAEMLEAQTPRVMTLEEIRLHEVYWVEQENVSRPWPIAMHHIRNAGLLDGPVYQDYMGDNFNTKEYGTKWRCWTSRPTDEQREATPWKATP